MPTKQGQNRPRGRFGGLTSDVPPSRTATRVQSAKPVQLRNRVTSAKPVVPLRGPRRK
jgi:hypothetical protein